LLDHLSAGDFNIHDSCWDPGGCKPAPGLEEGCTGYGVS
jgi:hypothetical protein